MSQSQANLVTGAGEFLRMILNPDETYVLGADIDLSIFQTLYPIGSVDQVAFSGTLIGNGYTVSGARLTQYDGSGPAGLFYSLDGATFEDVEFRNMVAAGGESNTIISPTSTGHVELVDVVVEGVVAEAGQDCAGVIGQSSGPITADGCEINVVATPGRNGGGLSATHTSGDIDISGTTFNFTAEDTGKSAGGAIGEIDNESISVSITDSECVADINGGQGSGGLIGQGGFGDLTVTGIDAQVKLEDASFCGGIYGYYGYYNIGNMEFDDIDVQVVSEVEVGDCGGVVGNILVDSDVSETVNLTATNINSSVSIEQTGNEVGGVVGIAQMVGHSAEISDCNTSVDVGEAEYGRVGGIAGDFEVSTHTISECECTVEAFTESSRIGGIVGVLTPGTETNSKEITSCNAEVDITGGRSGGLIGDQNGAQVVISECTATGEINDSGTGDTYAGGLVGDMYKGEINNCVANVDIDVENSAGGLLGYIYEADMSKCVALGDVTAVSGCSALTAFGSDGSVTQCASFGTLTVHEDGLGLAAGNTSATVIDNCYFLNDVVCKGSGTNGLFAPYGSLELMTNMYFGGNILEMGSVTISGGYRGPDYGEGVYYKEHEGLLDGRPDNMPDPTAVSLSESEMIGQDAEDNMEVLDFSNVWNWTQSYPVFQWQAPELVQVSGSITDAFGNPAVGEPVIFGDSAVSTDENGEYEIELEGGQSVDMVALGGIYNEPLYLSNDRFIDLQYSGIQVEVRHPYTDEPIEAAPVRVNTGAILTDENGIAEAPRLPGGLYNIQVLGIWEEEEVELDDYGDTVTLTFDGNDRSITADFEVQSGEEDTGLEEIDITLPQVGAETFTNSEGEATLVAEGIDGRAFIYVAKDDPRFETQSFEVPLMESQLEYDVTLQRRDPMRK